MAELEIQKIKDLLDTGFISEEEYERRIKEILGDKPTPSVFRIGVSNAELKEELLEENHLLAQLEQQLADVERRKDEDLDAHHMHMNKVHSELRANEKEFVSRLENLEKLRVDRRKRMQLLQDKREDLECLLSDAMELKQRIDVEARNGGDPLAFAAKKAEKDSELQELRKSFEETECQLKDLMLVEKKLACEIEDVQEQMDHHRDDAEKDLKSLTAEFKIKQEKYQEQIRCLVQEISALRDRVKETPKKHAEEDEKRKRLAERSAMEQAKMLREQAEMLRQREMELVAREIEEQRISMSRREEFERRSAEEAVINMRMDEMEKRRAEEHAMAMRLEELTKKRAEEVMELQEEMRRAKEKEEEERMRAEDELAMREAMEEEKMRRAEEMKWAKMRIEEEYAVKARMEEIARRLAEEAELKNALEEAKRAEYERSMRLKQEFQPSSDEDLEEELEELLGQVIKVNDQKLGLEMQLKEISKRIAEEHLSLQKCEDEFARRREEEEYELRRRKKVLDELANEEDKLADLVEERAARLIKVEQQLQEVTEVYNRRKTQN